MNLKSVGLALVLLAGAASASATIIENVTLNFQSGATWNGTITFADNYQGMLDTDGMLTGGIHNYNHHTTWTWWQGTNQTNPYDSNFDGLLNDWLMDGTTGGSYSLYIGLSWDPTLSVISGGIDFAPLSDPYYNGWAGTNDLITSFTNNSVPDTASTASLLGLALAGVVLLRRRRSA